jgi:predicted amidohydrolase
MKKIRAAAIQLHAGPDKQKNVHKATQLIAQAAARKAQLIVLPEVFNWRGKSSEIKRHGEPIPGPTSIQLAELAASRKLFIHCGSIIETHPHNLKPFNTSFLITPQGEICASYRKMHLFKLKPNNHTPIDESDIYSPGRDIKTVSTPFGTVGFSICYDLRFPELYRTLTYQGAEIIFAPSAFTFQTGKAHWETLVRARAIENQVYIIAPNQHGKDPLGNRNYGHSMIVDPWGTVIARSQNGEDIIYAELDPSYLKKVRKHLPVLHKGNII